MKSAQQITGVHLWLLLWRATRALEVHARQSVTAMELCLSDFGVLEALLHKGPLPVNELGRKVLLTSGSMTAAVDRLERLGLAVRKADERDRRTRIVHLTAQGKALIRKLFAEHERDMDQATAVLSQKEMAMLAASLRKLGRFAEQLANPSLRRTEVAAKS